jgi:diadenosine tetraphosphate (Ap4A) HIT family hydrolase
VASAICTPIPAPLAGWLILDARRHLSGPIDFSPAEARDWGGAVQAASSLVRDLSGCDRVYAVLFGEGARHLHLHLIHRHSEDGATEARAVADPLVVAALVQRARSLWIGAGEGSTLAP